MGNKGYSRPNIWGGYTHYDDKGHKTGESIPDVWGGYTHYDEKGRKNGSSMPDAWGGYSHYDNKNRRTGSSMKSAWGGYTNHDAKGRRIGSSMPDGLGGYHNDDSTACYIATCAYGSYDCPEVWVLRRFRDNVLAQNEFGRRFIRLYYAVSPKLVRVFGSNRHVKRLWRSCLSPLVSALQKRGFSNEPYTD